MIKAIRRKLAEKLYPKEDRELISQILVEYLQNKRIEILRSIEEGLEVNYTQEITPIMNYSIIFDTFMMELSELLRHYDGAIVAEGDKLYIKLLINSDHETPPYEACALSGLVIDEEQLKCPN